MAQTRISGGEWRGRLITTPKGMPLRPTRSMVREALFNILRDEVVGAEVVDIYAGVGSVGFEALSRGAAGVCFVERETRQLTLIAETAERLGCTDRCRLVRADAGQWVRGRGREQISAADITFLDAPYRDDAIVAVMRHIGDSPSRVVVCEHHHERELADQLGRMVRYRQARYGATDLSFWRRSEEDART